MARSPLSDVGCDVNLLNVGNDIVGRLPRRPGLGPNNACEVARS